MLIKSLDELREAVAPILRGEVALAAFDTETSEIKDERFTPFGTDSRIAGFSISFDGPAGPVDLYAAVRHRPYDWARFRRRDLLLADGKNDGPAWVRRLEDDEHVTQAGWEPGWDPNVSLIGAFALLRELFAVPDVQWVFHNALFDLKMLEVEGVALPLERVLDTQIFSVFTDERPVDLYDEEAGRFVHQGHALKHLGEEYLGRPADEQALLKQAMEVLKCKDFASLPLRTIVAPYAWQDTRLTLGMLHHMLARPAAQDPGVKELIRKHHLEMGEVLAMERTGVRVDVPLAQERAAELEAEQGEIRRRAMQVVGVQIELDNPSNLERQLYDDFGLPRYRDRKDTRKATLKQVRAKLAAGTMPAAGSPVSPEQGVAIIDAVLDYRRITKELTAFYRPLADFADDQGVIYPILNPLRAVTTRYSAAKPNIQQIPKPKKGKERESVRAAIVPRPGHVFIPLDYSTQELRIGAHYCLAIPEAFEYRFTWRCTLQKRGDCKGGGKHGPNEVHVGRRSSWSRTPDRMGLVEGFMTGDTAFDPHQAMVERCTELGVEIDRGTGKGANFALLYGAGIFKLAEILDSSYEYGKRIFGIFWERAYPELNRVKEFIGERLRRHGPPGPFSHQEFIRTLHGARIYLDGGFKGLNYLIQRSCREILLNAILDVSAYCREHAPSYRIAFPVHDELVLEVPEGDVCQEHVRAIARIMVEAGRASSVPMIVEPKICRRSWAETEDLPEDWGYNGVLDAREG